MSDPIEKCGACGAIDYTHRDGGPCCGSNRSDYLEGKREGIEEGIRIERARVIAHLSKCAKACRDAGAEYVDYVAAAQDLERGEHVAGEGE